MASWWVGGGVDPTYTVTLPRSFPNHRDDAWIAEMRLWLVWNRGSEQVIDGPRVFPPRVSRVRPRPRKVWMVFKPDETTRTPKVKKSPGRTFFSPKKVSCGFEPTRSRPEVCRIFVLLLENSSLRWKDWNINLNHITYGVSTTSLVMNTWLWIFSEISNPLNF